MKQCLPISLLAASMLLASPAQAQAKKQVSTGSGFTENKGQVSDQFGKPRPDVLFSCDAGELVYHLRKGGISYQLSRVERWKTEEDPTRMYAAMPKQERLQPDETTVYRLDMEWLNADAKATVETDEALPGYSNYYLAVCPDGARQVKTYTGLVYKNLYDRIDLHYYLNGKHLEYDYLVAPYADYHNIKIKVKGASEIAVQEDGSVLLRTPLGDIKEAAPLVYQLRKQVPARWVVKGQELSFSIDRYDPSLPLVIDPVVRGWGTLYGGSGVDDAKSCATDAGGNVYMCGRSNSPAAIATVGSHKATLSGTSYDAYLVKFDVAGVRQWATYYGGAGDDQGWGCDTDLSGNVYLTGSAGATSMAGMTTAGAHQATHGGNVEGFLVKFNSAGTRLWGTYYGSTGIDQGEAVVVNKTTSEVYMSGFTQGSTPASIITTAGAHQTFGGSALLVKFTPNGVRLWATVYGNSVWSHASCLAIDASGNVFTGGQTDATGQIATTGAHQTSFMGLYDAFIVKFNGAGVRQWGTYYGDISLENVGGLACDAAGNLYMAGISGSPSGIATPGAHQTVHGAAYNGDGMIVKFDGAGVRQWGTYYGGTTDDYAGGCVIAPNGDLYVSGYSQSVNAGTTIATPNGFQPVIGGWGDCFLAHFTTSGVRIAATYYGDANTDNGYRCAADANNNIYMVGMAQVPGSPTSNNFSSAGCHQSTFGGAQTDAFLVQFKECSAPASPVNITASANLKICNGAITTLTATSTGTVNWYNSASAGSSLGNGTVFTTPALSAGTVTFYAEATDNCTTNQSRTAITVTVIAPSTTIIASSPGVCAGGTATLTAFGANQYTWSSSSNATSFTVAPTASTMYTLTGKSVEGCTATATFTLLLYPAPTVTISAVNSVFCAGTPATLTASGANQYNWSTGSNGPLTIFTIPQNPTTYTVSGTNTQGCKGTASITVQAVICAGLKELGGIHVKLFPNPLKEVLYVELQGSAEVTISNAIGQALRKVQIDESGNAQIGLEDLAKGIYLVKVQQGQASAVYKVVKE